jgi:chemotaxis protein methyltransferase CheR
MDLQRYGQVMQSVKSILKIDLTAYKDEQMRRRLDAWLARSQSPGWDEYLARLRSDQPEQERLRSYLTINVTEFFRDIDRWNALRSDVIPGLLAHAQKDAPGGRGLRIWSAGCSTGAESYTLAILLDECSPMLRHYLLATDLDRSVLSKAQNRGPFADSEVRNLSAAQQQKYLEFKDQYYYVKLRLASRVAFREHNLLVERFESGFDLIVCRNVTIYFTQEAKHTLYQRFAQALRPGGILFLGGTEMLPRPETYGLRTQGLSFYQRM